MKCLLRYAWLTVFCLLAGNTLFAQLSGPGASSVSATNYTNGMPPDPIYIFCDPDYFNNPVPATLTATPPGGVPGWKFEWFSYNPVSNSWVAMSTDQNVPSSTRTNLASGGYRVVITDGNNVVQGCFRAWVWHKQTILNIIDSLPPSCDTTIIPGVYSSNSSFTYYNPPPDPFIIDANTEITVCFNAVHTYVSDLAFYMVGPGGGTVLLSPNPGANGQGAICNSGDNVNNLCFSTESFANLNVCANAPSGLGGTYGTYGPGNTPINWTPVYGNDATQGGWQVQIYDCIGADVGALTNATITFTGMASCGPSTVTYNSGNINSAINDNSCSAQTASIYAVPPPPPTVAQTLTYPTTLTWTSNPPIPGFPPQGPTLPLLIDSVPHVDTWFYLTASNALGCINVDSVLFHYSPPDTPVVAPPPVFCLKGPGDTLSVDITGGIWSGVGITDTITGFFDPTVAGSGIHQIIYTAPQPCGGRDTVYVTVSDTITFDTTITHVSCYGFNDGSISVTILTGEQPVTGLWATNPPQAGLGIYNLAPGYYTLVLQDGYGCTDTSVHVVSSPAALQFTKDSTDINCIGGTNGEAGVTVSGGTGPYNYAWDSNPVQYGAVASGLPQGTYTVIIRDDNGCLDTAVFNLVTLTVPPNISGVVTDESCTDLYDGSINLAVAGGTGPFTYLWSNSAVTEDISGINKGNYSVQVTDRYGCPYPASFTVGAGSAIDFTYQVSNVLCNGDASGIIYVNPLTGTPPYTYFVNNVPRGNSGALGHLQAGNYVIQIEDSRGCDSSFATVVTEPSALYADSVQQEIQLGDITYLQPTYGGGTGNLQLQWVPAYNLNCSNCAVPMAWPERTTLYEMQIIDENGCEISAYNRVIVNHDGPFIPNTFTPNADELNDLWKVVDYGVQTFELNIFNRWGERMFHSTDLYEGWNGKLPSGKLLESGVYVYKVDILYINGDEKTVYGHVTLLR